MPRRKSKGRALTGLLLFDKTSGESSNHALQKVKRLFNAAKAGHTGTLDPLATGLLVICFGRATKISNYFLTADKQYQVTLKLGETTTSGDADGDVLEQKDFVKLSQAHIQQAALKLTGEIEQVPPMYSALKHQGKRLYELARKGEEVERKIRKVNVHEFKFICQREDLVTMHVHCSKGTYVRTLVEDLGNLLNCGAHVVQLRRTSIGPFTQPNMYTLRDLEALVMEDLASLDALLLPVESALQHWPKIHVTQQQIQDIQHGRPINLPELDKDTSARIYDAENQFYGMANFNEKGKIAIKCLNKSV
ncbi:MAG: tRNA pseudouridine(55) synthase TruB [Pseudomonadota bacterium]